MAAGGRCANRPEQLPALAPQRIALFLAQGSSCRASREGEPSLLPVEPARLAFLVVRRRGRRRFHTGVKRRSAARRGAQHGGSGRGRSKWRRGAAKMAAAAPGVSPHRAAGRRPGTRGGGEGGGRVAPPPGGSAPSGRCRRRRTAMRFRGGTAVAGLLLALCVWAQVPRRSAAGTG